MHNAQIAEKTRKSVEEFHAQAKGAAVPANYWMTLTNAAPGWTVISIPAPGTLWVYYGPGSAPAEDIYVFHQGGATTPINVGENTIPVGAQDEIVYQLANPGADSIKLGYQLI